MPTIEKLFVNRLSELPPDGFRELMLESERAGLRLVRRLVTEWEDGSNQFARPGEVLFAAVCDERIVGVCGLNVDPYASNEDVGRVRHLYVLSEFRRQGIGRKLVEEVIAAARGRFRVLRLRTDNADAARLYERLGFQACDEQHCTHILDLKPPRSLVPEKRLR